MQDHYVLYKHFLTSQRRYTEKIFSFFSHSSISSLEMATLKLVITPAVKANFHCPNSLSFGL